MFTSLSDRLGNTLNKLRGVGRLSEDNIQESLREVRLALLEADVALEVVTSFVAGVKEKAVGQKVLSKVRPGEAFIKVVNDELTHVLGDEAQELNLKAEPPVVILMVGLQGSGKTTSSAKLANWLKQEKDKSVLLASVDVNRPAAMQQLQVLSEQVSAEYFEASAKQAPLKIAKAAIEHAKKQFKDVVIIDTAGRLHVDAELMDELKAIEKAVSPTETLLVVDSMAGQDAANIAKSFSEAIDLTGIVLTKTDGDSRGGAALSMRMLTQKPIKFIGVGEKIDALEFFQPDRIASRILGMGDIVSLVETAQSKVDQKQADKIAKKIKKGKRFDFEDFLSQLQQMQKMGGAQALLKKLPAGMGLPKGASALMDNKQFTKMEAAIRSMTPRERQFPALINGSRKRRIANGSGTSIQDVNKLLKQFAQMQKMLKRMKGNKMQKQMQNMQNMAGMSGINLPDLDNLS